LARDYQQGVDVKEDSEAWKVCKAQMSHSNPLVSFEFKRKAMVSQMGRLVEILKRDRCFLWKIRMWVFAWVKFDVSFIDG
jgi:hypothetical protein